MELGGSEAAEPSRCENFDFLCLEINCNQSFFFRKPPQLMPWRRRTSFVAGSPSVRPRPPLRRSILASWRAICSSGPTTTSTRSAQVGVGGQCRKQRASGAWLQADISACCHRNKNGKEKVREAAAAQQYWTPDSAAVFHCRGIMWEWRAWELGFVTAWPYILKLL